MGSKKIPDGQEVTKRQMFIKYLKEKHKAIEITPPSLYGVDVVVDINGKRKYFELKTSTKTKTEFLNEGYFGAITEKEWLCALTYKDDFYIVFVVNTDEKIKDNYIFIPVSYKDILSYASLEPFATYINIPQTSLEVNEENVFYTNGSKQWNGSHKKITCKAGSGRIDEQFILKYHRFYSKEKLNNENYENQNIKTIVYHVIPTNNVYDLIKNGIKRDIYLDAINTCNYEAVIKYINEKFGNDSHTTYAVIKINLHNYKYEIQLDGRILIKNKIRITSGNIVEMYFTLPPSQDIGEVIQDLF